MKFITIFFLLITVVNVQAALCQKKESKLYFINPKGDSILSHKLLQKITEVKIADSTKKILSFEMVITGSGYHFQQTVKNKSAKFNEDVRKWFQRIQPGATVIFYEIKIEDKAGNRLTIPHFLVRAIN